MPVPDSPLLHRPPAAVGAPSSASRRSGDAASRSRRHCFAVAPEPLRASTPSATGLPDRSGLHRRARAAGQAGRRRPKARRGYDISYPQCGSAFPSNPAFAIVGVNGGRVFSANPCLPGQIAWGGGAAAELYANTGNPGPALVELLAERADLAAVLRRGQSRHGRLRLRLRLECGPALVPDGAGRRTSSLGIDASPAATRWWLDVETSNSWRDDHEPQRRGAPGRFDYLRPARRDQLGFYSTTSQWNDDHRRHERSSPPTRAGAPAAEREGRASALRDDAASFTGGRLVLVQYIYQGFDAERPLLAARRGGRSGGYLAYSTARVSRMTVTLIWPG